MDGKLGRIAIIWRGDLSAQSAPSKYEARLQPISDALRSAGFEPLPCAFTEERADVVRALLLTCAGALVWVNPIADGRDRSVLDKILRGAAQRGVWVSAHPDVIAAMATKEVLFRTRSLGWGSDTKFYNSAEAFAEGFLARGETVDRVLKPVRGNDGRGVIRVRGGPLSFALHPTGADTETVASWDDLVEHVAAMLQTTPMVVDQECHDTRRGMVRCYMSFDKVIGFAEQTPRSSALPFAMNASKAMHAADDPKFADLRASMEMDWTPGLKQILGLTAPDLPALWDADFLYRHKTSDPAVPFALCEINASCVTPFPDCAPSEIANGLQKWIIDRA